jgi:phenylacetate-CoA ligase
MADRQGALDELEICRSDLLLVDSTHFAFLVRWVRRLGRRITSPRTLHMVSGYTHDARGAS